MQDFFKEMLEYTHHFNNKLADALAKNSDVMPPKAGSLFSHMLNAHNVWNTRILGTKQDFEIWQVHAVTEYKQIIAANHACSLRILSDRAIEEVIAYTNSRGVTFSNTIKDVLFQVINHSTYHRGQLAMLFRDHEVEPLLTEYIFYKR